MQLTSTNGLTTSYSLPVFNRSSQVTDEKEYFIPLFIFSHAHIVSLVIVNPVGHNEPVIEDVKDII